MSHLPAIVLGMLKPDAYPHRVQEVELQQTQMSYIFLTNSYVYKVKKPVHLGYLDYSTLEKRRFFCNQEVILNRRLCTDVYLDVVPIIRDEDVILVSGQGEVIEYAVKMRRLPLKFMMDVLLAKNQVSLQMVTAVAKTLVEFHQHVETNANIGMLGNLNSVIQNADENFSQTVKYVSHTLSRQSYSRIKAYTKAFIKDNADLFRKRVVDGRIRDCHGDLHAAHICFNSGGISIYDCIEFNDRFRYCDVASEIAFLAMDIDYHGIRDLSIAFVNAYVGWSQDNELQKLLNFYKCYRAYVRGKVESFKLDDPYISGEEKAKVLTIARKYFKLAESYI